MALRLRVYTPLAEDAQLLVPTSVTLSPRGSNSVKTHTHVHIPPPTHTHTLVIWWSPSTTLNWVVAYRPVTSAL